MPGNSPSSVAVEAEAPVRARARNAWSKIRQRAMPLEQPDVLARQALRDGIRHARGARVSWPGGGVAGAATSARICASSKGLG